MRQPPRYELYDLENDPFEFRNLANAPEYAEIFLELQSSLTDWRKQTGDPLLDPRSFAATGRRGASIKSKSTGKKHDWGYPDYFFGREPVASEPPGKRKQNAKNTSSLGESL